MPNWPILTHLKNKRHLTITAIAALSFFAFNYYLMANLPGEQNLACVMGASLTPLNITFSAVLSISTAIAISGITKLITQKQQESKIAITSISSGMGAVAGTLTMFCTLCTLPVLSIFGLSIGLQAFTLYSEVFQSISLALMLISLYMLNKQLKGSCSICKK